MAFTLQSEIDLVNKSLSRIAAGPALTIASQSSVIGVAANLHFSTTLKALLRSYDWPCAKAQDELYQIQTMLLDSMPTSAWSADDTITGFTSGTTATIYSVTSNTEYVLSYCDGDFTDGETITNGTLTTVYYEGLEVEYEDDTVYYEADSSSSYQVACGSGYPDVDELAPNHKWDYQYELPTDYIRLLSIDEDDGTDYRHRRWDVQGNRILTDFNTCNIDYIKSVTDPSDFDDLLYEILILQLALKLVSPSAGTKSNPLIASIKDDLIPLTASAKSIARSEQTNRGRSDWNLARLSTGLRGSTNIDDE